jgi:formate-dependent nitrite reductase membrane component NrfD
MVPEPDFQSYYGRPVLKEPTWKQPDVPLYLFLGGYAGASAILAEGAAAKGLEHLERVSRVGAALGAQLGTAALVHDLGRPARFLNMLRVLKVTSPLSVGSWILAPFTGSASAAAASQLTGRLPVLGRAAGLASALLGGPLATYTAALIANTAVPAWHEVHREMPFLFAGSAATAAGGVALATVPLEESGPARRLAVTGAAVELVAEQAIDQRLRSMPGDVGEPYHTGRAGALMKAAKVLTASGGVAAVLGRRSRSLSTASGVALVAGSLLVRFGVFQAGLASAKDPKYTVVPQRARLDARQDGHAPSVQPR